MFKGKVSKILYGGDYNPEQWPEEVWKEDMDLFDLAGIDIATINVFSWALNQLDEETYDFTQLDKIIDMLQQNEVKICLGTSTAAHPAWMAKKYSDVLIVDFEGRKRKYGQRHNSCPNSPTYRKYATRMAGKLAERYKELSDILLWHVNNEYGVMCYCDNCQKSFRVWLKKRYQTLEAVNKAWNTNFWGHVFYSWDEIVAPNILSEHLNTGNRDDTAFPGMSLDYSRFISDSILECYKLERDAIKKHIPNAIVTTNFQSNGTYKPLDYFKWAKELDVIAVDMYPTNDMPMSHTAFRNDLMRGLKKGSPFLLMESTPNQLNWKPQNQLKRPGMNRVWSYQSLARGAESIMYFQLRRSQGAFEKFHGAVIDHVGHENTRVFQECAEIGKELNILGESLLGSQTKSKVALIFDWENWWAIDYSSGLTDQLDYLKEIQKYYDAFYSQNISVDIIGVEDDLDKYDLVIAPTLYMIKKGYENKLEDYVSKGGTFVTTFFSGLVDENDLITLGGYPGKLKKLLGIWVEEIDALFPEQSNKIKVKKELTDVGSSFKCEIICDLLHINNAEVIAEFDDDFYKGMPAVTKNKYGDGEAWYIGSSPEDSFLISLVSYLCQKKEINPLLETPRNVEVTRRYNKNQEITFVINHNENTETIDLGNQYYKNMLNGEKVTGKIEISSKDVIILKN